ncbi:MAG: carbohydrate-binding protein SusD [Cytophagaceae bacterium SCN 52-12]|nr:MAG: carbohydrate-binding protein SusD [Cytophagaceae bacterium SCN 52-12]
MKKAKILYLTVLLTTGCSGFLDEEFKGQIVGNASLSTVEGLDAALVGAYKGLTNTWSTGFLHATAIGATMGGEDVTTHKASNKQEFREFDLFTVSAGNSRTSNLYNGCYKAIQGANNIINNYELTVGNQTRINNIAGEAYFIRALSYYWLTRLYGSIPLLTTAEFSIDLLTIGKTDPAATYELIESDLLAAEQLLPEKKRDPGRPNIGAAKALLADVYLTKAGWPIKDASAYALAAAKAKEVIDNKAAYGFDLMPTFAAVFDNDPTVPTLPEHVFQLSAFQSIGGNTNYGFAAMPDEVGGWNDYFPEINFFLDFPEGARKDKTFRTRFTRNDGVSITWEQTETKHPYYGKFWIKGDVKNFTSSLPYPMMRYAHVLTIYAEAKARSGGPDQLAYDAINAIRVRAGLNPLAGLSAGEFAAAVVQERAWEFAGERTRWFDLVRLEMVEAANADKHPDDMKPAGTITKNNYIFPLPLSETLANPNLN